MPKMSYGRMRGVPRPFPCHMDDATPYPCQDCRLRRARGVLVVVVVAVLASGCARVPVAAQRLVSKPNMVFGDSLVFADARRLVGQVEPGSAFAGGAQAAGCTACK